ncbi:MAG: glutamine amidotransferase [Candidatus Competibacteraceae bacterium]|nr:glutamine amidotransferase [Candidatus Competibacteraceae bacterium]
MKTVVAIRHVAFEDVGSFAEPLRQRDYEVRYLEAGLDDMTAIDPLQPELLIVLGGPIGVNDQAEYPFLSDELRLLEHRLQHHRPTLGICLGSQLMAHALGAVVYPATQKELGWAPIELTEAGQDSCLRHLDSSLTPVLHWHGDTFDLPEGAQRLASTAICPNQAFSWGRAALALQFHPEVTPSGLERWFIGHTLEIHTTPGVSVDRLRQDTARYGASLQRQGIQLINDWLDNVGRE